MKTILIFLFSILIFASCEKNFDAFAKASFKPVPDTIQLSVNPIQNAILLSQKQAFTDFLGEGTTVFYRLTIVNSYASAKAIRIRLYAEGSELYPAQTIVYDGQMKPNEIKVINGSLKVKGLSFNFFDIAIDYADGASNIWKNIGIIKDLAHDKE